jgi:hypothetical protein
VRRVALVLLASLAPVGAACAQQGVGDVVYVPTPQVVVDTMLRMANVGPADYLIDLGSGDGRVVITAAKRGARASQRTRRSASRTCSRPNSPARPSSRRICCPT